MVHGVFTLVDLAEQRLNQRALRDVYNNTPGRNNTPSPAPSAQPAAAAHPAQPPAPSAQPAAAARNRTALRSRIASAVRARAPKRNHARITAAARSPRDAFHEAAAIKTHMETVGLWGVKVQFVTEDSCSTNYTSLTRHLTPRIEEHLARVYRPVPITNAGCETALKPLSSSRVDRMGAAQVAAHVKAHTEPLHTWYRYITEDSLAANRATKRRCVADAKAPSCLLVAPPINTAASPSLSAATNSADIPSPHPTPATATATISTPTSSAITAGAQAVNRRKLQEQHRRQKRAAAELSITMSPLVERVSSMADVEVQEVQVAQEGVRIGKRCFVGNLPWRTSWQDLKDKEAAVRAGIQTPCCTCADGLAAINTYIPSAHRLAGIVVLRWDESAVTVFLYLCNVGRSKGWGIVEFETPDEHSHVDSSRKRTADMEATIVTMMSTMQAAAAINSLNGADLAGRRILVREDREDRDIKQYNPTAVPGEPGTPPPANRSGRGGGRGAGRGTGRGAPGAPPMSGGRGAGRGRGPPPERTGESSGLQVVVRGIPWSYNWKELKDMFEEIGDVERADVVFGEDGRSRGYGTVRFTNEEAVARAITRFNEQEWDGRPLKVFVDRFA
ncbi:hypothetical protein QJQ45_005336 [Haematococcus lacustris]|nr:hypothetical protein QJQ45_005336 [Haematococcus lacustris]